MNEKLHISPIAIFFHCFPGFPGYSEIYKQINKQANKKNIADIDHAHFCFICTLDNQKYVHT